MTADGRHAFQGSLRVDDLVAAWGGELRAGAPSAVRAIAELPGAAAGDLAFLAQRRRIAEAVAALRRGALVVTPPSLASSKELAEAQGALWVHSHPVFVVAELLGRECATPLPDPVLGRECRVHPTAVLYPGVELGDRVVVEAHAVVGSPGFGVADGPGGAVVRVPHRGGVRVGDDCWLGPSTTIAAGMLSPTELARGVLLDAQVHVGHNVHVGSGTRIAAQTGIAGSTRIGAHVLIGGQVGIADHLVIGDGARIAAKSGVIGDVPPRATVAGYPAVARVRWLRGLATLYRSAALGQRANAERAR